MYKLINPKNCVVHDFALKMYWGHNIEGSDKPFAVMFDELETQGYNWTVFCQRGIKRGDFITRNNHNYTKVLLYEVVKCERDKLGPFGPTDAYEVTAYQCGYYEPGTRTKTIFNGYGIRTGELDKLLKGVKDAVTGFFKARTTDGES